MNWFYLSNNEQKGPVTDEELASLVETGVVTAETQVWREGFAEWKLYGEVASPSVAPASTGLSLGLAGGTCSECGQSFKHEDLDKIDGRAVCGTCKPTLVQQMKEGVPNESAAEETRRTYIGHELAVRSIAIVYGIVGSFNVLVGCVGLLAASDRGSSANMDLFSYLSFIMFSGLVTFGVAYVWIGLKVRKLDPRFRIPAAVFAGLGIALGIPFCIGGIIPAYILWLLVSQKGKVVFSDQYARVIEMTPHIKPKMWIVLKILLILVGVLFLLGFLAWMFGAGSGDGSK